MSTMGVFPGIEESINQVNRSLILSFAISGQSSLSGSINQDSNLNYNFKTSNSLLTKKDAAKSTIHKYKVDL